jgi:hypothetical protein
MTLKKRSAEAWDARHNKPMADVTGLTHADGRPMGGYGAAMTAGAAWPGVPDSTMTHYVSLMNSYVDWCGPHINNLHRAQQDIQDWGQGDYFDNAGVHDAAERVVRTGHVAKDAATEAAKWVSASAQTVANTKRQIIDAVNEAIDDIDSINSDTGLSAAEKQAQISQIVSTVHGENVTRVSQCAASIATMPRIDPPTFPFSDPGPGPVWGVSHNGATHVMQTGYGSNPLPQNPPPPAPKPGHGPGDAGKSGLDQPYRAGDTPEPDIGTRGTPGLDVPAGQPPQPIGPYSPAMPTPMSPLGSSGGVPRPPSIPSSPVPPLTTTPAGGAGSSPPVTPAALSQPLQAVSPTPIVPPAAAGPGAGPVAPLTTPTPVAQPPIPETPPPLAAAAAPAAAGPPSAPSVPGGAPMGGMPMLPPMMAGGPMGGTPAAPPSMTPPSPPVPAPNVPALPPAPAVNPVGVPITQSERGRLQVIRTSRNVFGEIAALSRQLAAWLTVVTRRAHPDILWCVGGRGDDGEHGQTLVVANNIGLTHLPPEVSFHLNLVEHVHAAGAQIEWGIRRWWVGDPIRAVIQFGQRTPGKPVSVVAGVPALFAGRGDVVGVHVEAVTETPDDLRYKPGGPVDRLTLVDESAAATATAATDVNALIAKLPEAGDWSAGREPDPALSKALWGAVTSALAFQQAPVDQPEQRIPPGQHIAAWRAFCQQQAAASAHRLRGATTLEAAARRYADWRYWTWNLDQLKLEDEYKQAHLRHETEVGG